VSGHSKWATIKHGKALADAKRGKVFSRISKEISIAVREGGNDSPDFNPRLRVAIEKAKAENMPKDNVKRAIDKGAGRVEGTMYEEISYEGFGPNKVAMIVECVTDNKNRTNSEVRALFDKNGGALGSSGSTGYFFDRKGAIVISLPDGTDSDEIQLQLIDLGAEDFKQMENGNMQVIVDSSQTHKIADEIKKAGINIIEADITMIPNTHIDLSENDYQKFLKLFEIIDDYEDVQKIFHNAKKA
jgi:YebC/PmpR family DNA-binding regulatory protein